jgi:hypothetical protein
MGSRKRASQRGRQKLATALVDLSPPRPTTVTDLPEIHAPAPWHATCPGNTLDDAARGRRDHVKITVEIEEFDGVTTSHAVAAYVRAMLKVRSLRRAVGEALLEVESCKQRLRESQMAEAQTLLESLDTVQPRPRLLRRPTKRPRPRDRG